MTGHIIWNSSRNSLFGRIDHFDLVGDPPQERVVDQVRGLQVRGEDDQLVEGDLDFLAIGQIQEVVAFFQAARSSG